MPSRAWVVTQQHGYKVLFLDIVSMPSRAWVVTNYGLEVVESIVFQCPLGLELLHEYAKYKIDLAMFQCPLGLELLHWRNRYWSGILICFNALSGLSCYGSKEGWNGTAAGYVSMPSRAWVVTRSQHQPHLHLMSFNALSGLSCYGKNAQYFKFFMMLFMHTCYL